jgi:hypothetical protein
VIPEDVKLGLTLLAESCNQTLTEVRAAAYARTLADVQPEFVLAACTELAEGALERLPTAGKIRSEAFRCRNEIQKERHKDERRLREKVTAQTRKVWEELEKENVPRPYHHEVQDMAQQLGFHELESQARAAQARFDDRVKSGEHGELFVEMCRQAHDGATITELRDYFMRERKLVRFAPGWGDAPEPRALPEPVLAEDGWDDSAPFG